jgi:hypothetical protein
MGACVAAALCTANESAAADEGTEPIRVEYSAPAACPSADDFAAQVHARTDRPRAAAPGEPARTFKVTVTTAPTTAGRLVIRDVDGMESVRNVKGATCSEVVEALALFTALAVDPLASTSSAVELQAPRPARAAPTTPAPTPAPEHPPTASPSTPSARWEWSVGAHGGVATGVVPTTLLVIPIFVAIERQHQNGWAWAPALRAEGAWSRSTLLSPDDPRGRYSWAYGALSASPVAWEPASRITVRPWIAVEVGAIDASGGAVQNAREEVDTWVAAVLSAHVAWRITRGFSLHGEAGVASPLQRYRFYLGPDETLYIEPLFGLRAAVGLSASL